jgi:hypothetical protein
VNTSATICGAAVSAPGCRKRRWLSRFNVKGLRGKLRHSRREEPPVTSPRPAFGPNAKIPSKLLEQLARRQLDRFRQLEERRYLRIAFAGLDSAYLSGMDATAFCDLLLGQAESFASVPQVGAEVAHERDRLPWEPLAP